MSESKRHERHRESEKSHRKSLARPGILLGITFLVIASVVAYVVAYENTTITEGSAYGFEIGESRSMAFSTAMEKYADGTYSGMVAKREGRFGLEDVLPVNEQSRDRVWDAEQWVFFFSDPKTFSNSINLSFESDEVVTIWRYRLPFELP